MTPTLPERIRKLGEWDEQFIIDHWRPIPATGDDIESARVQHSRDSFAYELLAEAADTLDQAALVINGAFSLGLLPMGDNICEQLVARIAEAVKRMEEGK